MSHRASTLVSADLEEIRRIGPWIRVQVSKALTDGQIEIMMPTVELVVQELAVNIVEHGYDTLPGGSISIELLATEGHVDLTVVDSGKSYNPEDIATPDIEDLQIGGYGVMIIKKLTSEFEVERVDSRNVTRLRFDVPTPSS